VSLCRLALILSLGCAGLIGAANGIGSLIPPRLAAYASAIGSRYTIVDLNHCISKTFLYPGLVNGLAWSPDGAYLAVRAETDTAARNLAVLTWDSRTMIDVTDDSANKLLPVWSADGHMLLYASDRLDGDARYDYDIYGYEIATGTTRRLSDAYETATTGRIDEYHAALSPDGRTLAIIGTRRSGNIKVDLLDTQTGDLTPLRAEDTSVHQLVAWSPPQVSPAWVLFRAYTREPNWIQLYDASTGEMREIAFEDGNIYNMNWTSTGDIFVHWNANGTWDGFRAAVLSPMGNWTTRTPIPCIDLTRAAVLTVHIP